MIGDEKKDSTLDDDDAALWSRVTQSTTPLSKPANRHVEKRDVAETQERPSRPGKKAPGKSAPQLPTHVEVQPSPPAPPPLGGYDKSEVRAISSGKLNIEARIDLHGMRQREAHAALQAFIAKCQSRGQRHVLVITGKGAGDRPGERGVLNREVPRWLNEPDFRLAIVGFTQAHRRHGGEGALYVRLRRKQG